MNDFRPFSKSIVKDVNNILADVKEEGASFRSALFPHLFGQLRTTSYERQFSVLCGTRME